MTVSPPSRSTRVNIAELRSFAITGLFVLAVLYTLHLGQDFFLPIVLALFLASLLRPVVRLLRRIKVPGPIAPAVVLVLLLVVSGSALYQLWVPATDWVARAPVELKQIEGKLKKLLRPVQTVTRTAQQVEQFGDVTPRPTTPQVALREPGLAETIFGRARHAAATTLIVVVLSYFYLASGENFLRKLPRVLPRQHAERVLEIVGESETQISSYLLEVTLIN